MLVVLASRHDSVAHALVTRWTAHKTALLTCADLSVAGWRYFPDAPHRSTVVVSGRSIAQKDISGVLVRLPYIGEAELLQIAPAERNYVAAEMNAFLLSWLSALQCPVLNRPTPTCLAGPYWRHLQWVYTAVQLGIPVYATATEAGAANLPFAVQSTSRVAVTVVGDQCFGTSDELLMRQARSLAAVAKVELLTVYFDQSSEIARFLDVDLIPDVSCPAVADGILAALLRG